jgi:hypothetical protein
MATDFESFAPLFREKPPAMTYKWAREKALSCQWILDKIRDGTKVPDVGRTVWMCRKLQSKGCDISTAHV